MRNPSADDPTEAALADPRTALAPPALWEIFILPIVGAAIIGFFHTKQNELALMFLPFLVAVFRLFIAQFKLPPVQDEPRYRRAARISVAINQLAIFPLILFEFVVVMLSDPTVPIGVWLVAAFFFAVYVGLRLLSRIYWIAAAGPPSL